MNTEELEKLVDTTNSSGLQVFVDVTIKSCAQYGIEFSKQRRDKRRIYKSSFDEVRINPQDGKIVKIEHYQSTGSLDRTIDGKKNLMDVTLGTFSCSHMDTNPTMLFTVRSSPFNRIHKPTLKVECSQYKNGQFEKYIAYDGILDGFDKEIDITKPM